MSNTVKLFMVGNRWFYTVDKWKGTVGPFLTLQEASEALTNELTNNGKKEGRGSDYLIQDHDNI